MQRQKKTLKESNQLFVNACHGETMKIIRKKTLNVGTS